MFQHTQTWSAIDIQCFTYLIKYLKEIIIVKNTVFKERIHLQCGSPELDPWVEKIPWRRERLPTPVFWPEEFHGLYTLRGRKKSDTTERLSLSHKIIPVFIL